MLTVEEMNRLRKEMGYSYKMLSEKSGVPLSTVQKIFGGRIENPRFATLESLRSVFETQTEEERVAKLWDYGTGKTNQQAYESTSSMPGVVRDGDDWRYGTSPRILSDDGKDWTYATYRPHSEPFTRQGHYTVADYRALPDDDRVELIDGWLIRMDAPTSIHQVIVGALVYLFQSNIDKNAGTCIVMPSPLDVQLDKDDTTMIQPDVVLVCDHQLFHGSVIFGAPELLIEVLSKSSVRKDTTVKLRKYKRAGVKEYWIVDPFEKKVYVYRFASTESGRADEISFYNFDDRIPVGVWDDKESIDFAYIRDKVALFE